jgi:hypothetical protein
VETTEPVHLDAPVAEIVEPVAPVVETTEPVQLDAPVAETVEPVAPVVETTEPVAPALETTEPAAPVVQETTESAAPVAQETTEPAAPVAQETAKPVMQEATESAAPVAMETTEPPAPVVQETTESATPVVQEPTEPTTPAVETVDTAAPVVQESTEPAAPVLETVEKQAPVAEETNEAAAPLAETVDTTAPVEEKEPVAPVVEKMDTTAAVVEEKEEPVAPVGEKTEQLPTELPTTGTPLADAVEVQDTPTPAVSSTSKVPSKEPVAGSRPSSGTVRRPAEIPIEEADAAGYARPAFHLSPSVGAWLQQAPANARLRLNELATQEPTKAKDDLGLSLEQSPSVGAWLRAAPEGADTQLRQPASPQGDKQLPADVTDTVEIQEQPAVAEAQARLDTVGYVKTPFPFSPSVGSWLQSKSARTNLADAVVAASTEVEKEQLPGDFRVNREVFDNIHDLFAKEQSREVTPRAASPRDSSPLAAAEPKQPVEQPEVTLSPETTERPSSRQRPENARFMTNSTATREQVLNFAQSLTSSIFRNSNTLAMHRAASQPPMRQPSTFTAPRPAMGSSGSIDTIRAQPQQRPVFRKQRSPIPAEEGAFFD